VTVKATVYHVQVNVRDPRVSLPFYRELFRYLELAPVHDEDAVAGFSDGRTAIWLIAAEPRFAADGSHRKRPGLNHLALRVVERGDVDRFAREFLEPRGIPALYGTPREFPEYAPGYYAVFFEDPDRLKLEVVHRPERTEGAA
jgi:catechol 2,3-dioxygenase-like lactoylglutathione lyase family enzyme